MTYAHISLITVLFFAFLEVIEIMRGGLNDCAELSLDLTTSGSTSCYASPVLPLTQRSPG